MAPAAGFLTWQPDMLNERPGSARSGSSPVERRQIHGSQMKLFRNFNNSFVHGVAAYSAYTLSAFLPSQLGPIAAFFLCVYAGWFSRACLASFLGGVTVAVIASTTMGALEVGFGVFFMVPFALLVILPAVLGGYIIGKIIFTIMHRRHGAAELPRNR
jgi:hypothetical protein